MEKRIFAIRGATRAENSRESILQNVESLCKEIFEKNNVLSEDIVSIMFTQTRDLDELNPCYALRHGDVGIDVSSVALFSTNELEIKGMLSRTIRVMVTAYLPQGSKISHVYKNGAEVLRPDFAK